MKPHRFFVTPQFDRVPRSPSTPAPSTPSTTFTPANSASSSTSSTSAPPIREQCTYTTSDGRHCRMFRSADHPDLCDHHAQKELRSLDRAVILPLAAQLLGPLKDFRSAAAINAAVGNAFVQLADGRLDPRRAAVLAYMAQLLFQTLRKVSWEEVDSSPSPNLERALKATIKATLSKSEAEKIAGQIFCSALDEGGPAALNLAPR